MSRDFIALIIRGASAFFVVGYILGFCFAELSPHRESFVKGFIPFGILLTTVYLVGKKQFEVAHRLPWRFYVVATAFAALVVGSGFTLAVDWQTGAGVSAVMLIVLCATKLGAAFEKSPG